MVVVDEDGIPLSPAAAAVRSRLGVQALPGGRLVNIQFRAYDPSLAARMANTLAELYIEQARALRATTSGEATDWLAARLKEEKRKIDEGERALLAYQEKSGLSGLSQGGTQGADASSNLSQAVLAARTERIAKESAAAQARGMSTAQLAAFPAVSLLPSVQEARAAVAARQAELARLSETLGDKHPDMVRVRAELAGAQEMQAQALRDAVRALEADADAARAREASHQVGLEGARRDNMDTSRRAIEYNALRREVDSRKEIYESLLGRSTETGLESELTATAVRIVERAEPPAAPYSPRRMRNYQLAFLIGLALGVGLAMLFEHADNTVKTPEDLKEMNLPFLGLVPRSAHSPSVVTQIAQRAGPDVAVEEAYRVIRTNLVFASPGEGGKVLLVTSANPSEGKTTSVAHLAAALAGSGARVLVVDADLRRPALHRQLRAEKAPGLSDLVVSRCQASQAILATNTPSLKILPSGHPSPNPAELLGSPRMREIIEALRGVYDWVIIDTPPVLAMADTPVLCPLVDGAVLVVASEESSRPAVLRAVEQITRVGGKLTGVVLNRVDLRRNSYYYGQYYGEYYRSYYATPQRDRRDRPPARRPTA
jgi:capsular exopolysaccharide synthesis family protein